MSTPRRLTVLLASSLLAVAPAAPALAQSAGDEQYADPFAQSEDGGSSGTTPSLTDTPQGSGSSGSGSSGSGSSGSGSTSSGAGSGSPSSGSGSGSSASPSAAPSAPGAQSGAAGAPGSPTGTAPSASSRSELPNTGLDARGVAVLGMAFVLLGIGLRLRTADVRP